MSDQNVDVSYCGDSLMGVAIAIAVVQILIVVARFYTRYMQRVACALDDYLIVPALVASLGQSALYIVLLKVAGLGYHMEYVMQTPQKLVSLEKGLYANQILDFPFTVTPAKISILLFYIRIFNTFKSRMFAYAVGLIVMGHGIGVFFAAIFQCSPVAYTWDKTIQGGTCFDQQAFYRYVSPPNILTDVVILVMPMPFVWRLHTRMGQKLALTAVFLLGGLGTVASILRMTIFFQENAMTDPTWASVNLGIWTVLEGGIIIIAACLPSIWPLIVRILPRQLMSKHSSKPKNQQRHRYTTSQHKTKGVVGFARLGDSAETDKWPLDTNPSLESQTVTPDDHPESISMRSMEHRET
ncbi:hypothetical protein P170DRAFT_479293 [Aspergillus steynii IBT 23096]|uniref:Rhodopsin domain-containing protein n=1 Tax=Aspergillus steynii IBT 23096 TaxID=1392250 RepID=A0A2I2FVV4_9EURO|nr:uncharacterized protein P170DRAFT_479293 [Aspergillus steynii IBT 23096]PLB44745.1 hypothetical protein P170DRAFT_479293 [Aspergillus steynii IBT 23096]